MLSKTPHGLKFMEYVEHIGLVKGLSLESTKEMSETFTCSIMGARYKPVTKKFLPVSMYDPDSIVPSYIPIELRELQPLPTQLIEFHNCQFTARLTKERVAGIVAHITPNFLTKVEVDLLVNILLMHEKAIAFTDAERGTFNGKYYPDYVMRTIPHTPWQIKPLRLPQAHTEEIMSMLWEQMDAGKYEPSCSSYCADSSLWKRRTRASA